MEEEDTVEEEIDDTEGENSQVASVQLMNNFKGMKGLTPFLISLF